MLQADVHLQSPKRIRIRYKIQPKIHRVRVRTPKLYAGVVPNPVSASFLPPAVDLPAAALLLPVETDSPSRVSRDFSTESTTAFWLYRGSTLLERYQTFGIFVNI